MYRLCLLYVTDSILKFWNWKAYKNHSSEEMQPLHFICKMCPWISVNCENWMCFPSDFTLEYGMFCDNLVLIVSLHFFIALFFKFPRLSVFFFFLITYPSYKALPLGYIYTFPLHSKLYASIACNEFKIKGVFCGLIRCTWRKQCKFLGIRSIEELFNYEMNWHYIFLTVTTNFACRCKCNIQKKIVTIWILRSCRRWFCFLSTIFQAMWRNLAYFVCLLVNDVCLNFWKKKTCKSDKFRHVWELNQ